MNDELQSLIEMLREQVAQQSSPTGIVIPYESAQILLEKLTAPSLKLTRLPRTIVLARAQQTMKTEEGHMVVEYITTDPGGLPVLRLPTGIWMVQQEDLVETARRLVELETVTPEQ